MSAQLFNEEPENDTEGVVMAKGVSMAVLFCASMICGLAPLVISRRLNWVTTEEAGSLKNTNKVVMTLLSFGGGVLLSTTFLHLMPEIHENIEYLQSEYHFIVNRKIVLISYNRIY
jgi:solute carrier family 39 (zinc transporter), member 1/2/3